MEKEKVKVISTIGGLVSVYVPSIPFKREWISKGVEIPIEKEVLEQLMYDNGFKYMIDTGILYIEEMKIKKELGIEPEDAEVPTKVIILDDKKRRRFMVNLSLEEFKKEVDKLSREQIVELADYAIANRLTDYEKSEYIKEKCGRDIIQTVKLNKEG